MNMKKTLAGVMAGAMAVSAMATVVSADQDAISLTYDLKTYVKDNNKTKAKVTVVANYEGSLISEESLAKGYVTFGADNGFVTGSDIYTKDGNAVGKATVGKMKEFEFTARPYKDLVTNVEEKYQTYKATGDAKNVDGAYYVKDLDNGVQAFNMPIATGKDVYGKFDLNKYDIFALGYSTADSREAAGIQKLVGYNEAEGVVTPGKPAEKTGDAYYMIGTKGEKVAINIASYTNLCFDENRDYIWVPGYGWGLIGIEDGEYYSYNRFKDSFGHDVEKKLDKLSDVMSEDNYKKFDANVKANKYNFGKDKATLYLDNNSDTTTTAYHEDVMTEAVEEVKGIVKTAKDIKPGTYAVRDAVAKMTYEVPNTVQLNKANGWGWDYSYKNGNFTEAEMEHIFQDYFGASLYGDVTMTAEVFAKGFWTATAGVKKGVIKSATTLVSDPTTVGVGAFTAGAAEEAVIPFKTTLKPGLKTDAIKTGYVKATNNDENNVLAALSSRKAGGNYYTKPVAVINDAIANHDNVVFTFTSYNGYVGTAKSQIVNQWVNVDQGYDYKTSDYDWHNPTFGQHLYTNLADAYSLFDSNEYDQYGSYSSAWGINLFTGAVVVNSGLTMQLSDTDKFDWGDNTLSFDWFDITDEGKITDAKTFLTSMLLYTPTDWYWDTLTVVVSDDEDEAIDAGEGLDGEGDVIDDEEPAEDVVEEEPTEDVVEEPAETEAAPVETAPSPATGNAPVALAVIPVALAAAAVVAKKRG